MTVHASPEEVQQARKGELNKVYEYVDMMYHGWLDQTWAFNYEYDYGMKIILTDDEKTQLRADMQHKYGDTFVISIVSQTNVSLSNRTQQTLRLKAQRHDWPNGKQHTTWRSQ